MIVRELLWDRGNAAHVEERGVRPGEVDEAVLDGRVHAFRHGERYIVTGRTEGGRYVTVTLKELGRGVFKPVTARQSDATEVRLAREAFGRRRR